MKVRFIWLEEKIMTTGKYTIPENAKKIEVENLTNITVYQYTLKTEDGIRKGLIAFKGKKKIPIFHEEVIGLTTEEEEIDREIQRIIDRTVRLEKEL